VPDASHKPATEASFKDAVHGLAGAHTVPTGGLALVQTPSLRTGLSAGQHFLMVIPFKHSDAPLAEFKQEFVAHGGTTPAGCSHALLIVFQINDPVHTYPIPPASVLHFVPPVIEDVDVADDNDLHKVRFSAAGAVVGATVTLQFLLHCSLELVSVHAEKASCVQVPTIAGPPLELLELDEEDDELLLEELDELELTTGGAGGVGFCPQLSGETH
jgi:hypothetical protein